MSLELSGKVTQILPLEIGDGKNGQWKKQFFVIEYMDGNYPKKACFSAWGDKTDALSRVTVGTEVDVKFNLESREYNGKFYTDAKAWFIKVNGQASQPSSTSSDGSDDVPF